ncbi:TonB family protein [Xenococcus sp. PCC 7305]|uniref:energy transducer TonB family protein n=1 Tax=Xenococcus sp. PCC 7305 TaxID=102125 RepID=UPI0002AC2F73|nr:energy transducer TonB [Xenococcus sp. PCC 7305]ELS00494.1 TonB family protein [Xenococcus sp. PCC 7305]
MSTSQFCIQQRQQEQQKIKRLLILGLTSSALLHGILALAIPQWSIKSPEIAKPLELILVDKPKPEPIPKPEPKIIESKPIVQPKPKSIPKPKPIQAKTPPPPVKTPEPVKTHNTPPKPVPKKIFATTPTAPSSIVSAPIANTTQTPSVRSSLARTNSSIAVNSEGSINPNLPEAVTTVNNAPPRPKTKPETKKSISCIDRCKPEYPAVLEGAEGSAGVQLTIDSSGNVISAELASPNSNSQVNRQALLAARRMQFSTPPSGNNASVQVNIEFTVAGSEYDRLAREAQKKREQAQKAQQEQEQLARQRQLEQERQARQQQLEQERLERERQARQQQLEEQQVEASPSLEPLTNDEPVLLETEVDDEVLRQFRERIERQQQN